MTDTIKHEREAQGKTIAPHHFSNEADLINRIALGMTSAKFRVHHEIGKKEAIRDYLTPEQIHCITELQRANTVFIGMGWDFEQRKATLMGIFNKNHRQPLIEEQHLPPETMVPKVSGGIPRSGKDFNGILNELSAMGRWANAGAGYPFDAAFANAIGGYPAGAKIPNVENSGFWLNTVDNNLDNPEVADDRLTGRVPAENYGIATLSGLVKADVTLTTLQSAKARIVLTGELKANMAVIFPAWQTSWTVVNQCTGSGSLICRTKAGAGVLVPKGESREIVGDGSGLVPRIVNATTSVAGITQLSNATHSDSETMAATPKAVKALADTLSGGRLLNIQSFTKSGIYTPTPGTRKIRVKCWCAGGGGAGMSKQNRGSVAGAAGAYAEALLNATSFSSVSVEVGTGGAASADGVSLDGGYGILC
ncbi:Phage tail fibre repeat protein [Sodalis glossinidius str. 'morsitans']|uniref:Phage tail fibre repeat protein n=2 Tax=Sodalis glossinidius TaxID=63612 RepID=A0A193QFK2_SODGM|nr:Phage tail fibre repeat protein [Sodalis glossinidius str. 'morsitans']